MKRKQKRPKRHHYILAVILILGLGFYLGQTQRKIIPPETSETVAKVLTEAGELISDVGQSITDGNETETETIAEDAPVEEVPEPEVPEPAPPETSTSFQTNQACIDLIKRFEGVRLEAYREPGGTVVVGYGHAKTARMGMKITAAQAEDLLKQDLAMVEGDISPRLTRPVTENQFSAMVCLAYNIGTGAFADSTVLRETNRGNWQAAADAFLMWNKMRVNGEMVVSSQLDEKRRLERALYLKP